MHERLGRLPAADPPLQAAARERFWDLLGDRADELAALRRDVNAGGDLAACWERYRESRRRSVTLARELLAFVEGAYSRHAGLDLGLLRIAEALLTDLSRRLELGWDPLVVLAEAEFYGEEAQIIRLRFPDVSVWNLTVAAHEFGHFAGPRLSAKESDGRSWDLDSPFRELLRRERERGPREWARMHELMADLFAVYTMGPAYVCSCLLLRFDPGATDVDGPTHPSAPKRAALLLWALERMEQEGDEVSGVLQAVRARWTAGVAGATGRDPAAVEAARRRVAQPLEATFEELWEALRQTTARRRRYDRLAVAQRLKTGLAAKAWDATVEDDVALVDVLNAAWLSRIDHWDDDRDLVPTIGGRSLALCNAIVDRGPPDR